MLRVGIDMIEVSRIERGIERHGERFYNRFFTLAERTHCGGNIRSLAARFAAKEAVAKAFGTGIGDIRWVEIEILGDDRRRPTLHLHGDAKKMADELGLTTWDVSLSHTETHAIAMVVAMAFTDSSD